MNASFDPSPEFVAKVMHRVRAYEERRLTRFLGYLRFLAAGGALLGLLRAAPVF